MRSAFHDDLDHLSDQLVEMTRLAGSGMARATTALLDADLAVAESVIAADEQVDRIQRELDELALDLLARQQPVATDLRTIVTAMRMSADLERMGDLARHVAKVARRRYPESAVPPALRATVLQMGQVAERIVAKAGSVIASKDVAQAVQLEQDDDEMDRLHRELFAPAARAARGSTAWRPPSTSRWSAATTSGSPTTPSRWRGGWSTWPRACGTSRATAARTDPRPTAPERTGLSRDRLSRLAQPAAA